MWAATWFENIDDAGHCASCPYLSHQGFYVSAWLPQTHLLNVIHLSYLTASSLRCRTSPISGLPLFINFSILTSNIFFPISPGTSSFEGIIRAITNLCYLSVSVRYYNAATTILLSIFSLFYLSQIQDQGVDPNLRDGDGATPLHFAASRGHLETVRWLLKHGARLSLDKFGKSPINDAAENQQVEVKSRHLNSFILN